MRAYIKKLQAKEEDGRKRIFVAVMICSMSVVTLVWVYSLGVRFGSPKIKDQASEDIKPFKLFSNSISDTFNNIGASVGKAPTVNKEVEKAVNSKEEKQIDLIPVEYSNQ